MITPSDIYNNPYIQFAGFATLIYTLWRMIRAIWQVGSRAHYWSNGAHKFHKMKLSYSLSKEEWHYWRLLRKNYPQVISQVLCPEEWEQNQYQLQANDKQLPKLEFDTFKNMNESLHKKLGLSGAEAIKNLLRKNLVEDREFVPGRSLVAIRYNDNNNY